MDTRTGQWRRKFDHELQKKSKMTKIYGFIRSQKIQRLGHVMRSIEDAAITLLYCSRGLPSKEVDRCGRKSFEGLGSKYRIGESQYKIVISGMIWR